MKLKLLVPLIILSILAIIIVSGCGGDDGVNPSSIPQDEDLGDRTGSIHIQIKWPENKAKGSCIISSGKNTLTASMPLGTHYVKIKVYYEEGSGTPQLLGEGDINYPNEDMTIIKELPLAEVTVVAEAWSEEGGIQLSTAEDEIQVYMESTYANLNLGEYILIVNAEPNPINLGEETTVTAELYFEEGTNTTHNYELVNREISFEVRSGDATFPGSTTEYIATTVPLDPPDPLKYGAGECDVILKSSPGSEENIEVYASCSVDSDTVIATGLCTIEVGDSPQAFQLIPEKTTINIEEHTKITAKLQKYNADTGEYEGVEGQIVYADLGDAGFETAIFMDEYTGFTSAETMEFFEATNSQGETYGTIIGIDSGTITVTGSVEDPENPNNTLTASCDITVTEEENTPYFLTIGKGDDFIIIPDFESDYLANRTVSSVWAELIIEDYFGYNSSPAEGKTIQFTIEDGDAYFEEGGRSVTLTTDAQGRCLTNVLTDAPGPREIEIKIEFVTSEENASIPPPETCILNVKDNLIFRDDFESYIPNVDLYEAGMRSPEWGDMGRDEKDIIDNTVAAEESQSLRLYGGVWEGVGEEGGSPTYESATFRYAYSSVNYNPIEARFWVRVGNELLKKPHCSSHGGIWDRGQCYFVSARANLTFRETPSLSEPDIYDNSVFLCHGENIGVYPKEEWMYIKIQYIPSPDKYIASYWINGSLHSYTINEPQGADDYPSALRFYNEGGSFWIDKVGNL